MSSLLISWRSSGLQKKISSGNVIGLCCQLNECSKHSWISLTDKHFVICRKGSSFHLTCLESNPLQNKWRGMKVCYLELGSCFLKPLGDKYGKLCNFPGTSALPIVVQWNFFRVILKKCPSVDLSFQ